MDEQLPDIVELDSLWEPAERPGTRLKRIAIPRVDREFAARSIIEAFHHMGGQERFSQWAHDHPSMFYPKLLTKIMPPASQTNIAAGQVNFIYHAAIPPGPLDQQDQPYAHESSSPPPDARTANAIGSSPYAAISGPASYGDASPAPADEPDAAAPAVEPASPKPRRRRVRRAADDGEPAPSAA